MSETETARDVGLPDLLAIQSEDDDSKILISMARIERAIQRETVSKEEIVAWISRLSLQFHRFVEHFGEEPNLDFGPNRLGAL